MSLHPRQRYAVEQRHHDACPKQSIAIMENSPLGQEAIEGMYYTEMSAWLLHEMKASRTPTGVPKRLLDQWKLIGVYRRERQALRKTTG